MFACHPTYSLEAELSLNRRQVNVMIIHSSKSCRVGRAAAWRRIEDSDARGPGRGNVSGWDADRQSSVVDVRGRAITPVPAHDRAAHKAGAIDREGERGAANGGAGWVETRDRGHWIVD